MHYRTLVLFLFAVSTSGFADDWPQFRGPGGLGVSSETNLPVKWNEEENVAWKVELPGFGASSPITLGDKIYVTCYSGYGTDDSQKMEDLTLHVACMNRADGSLVWDSKVKPKLPESDRVRDHGYAGPTPATDGEHLYVFFGKTGVLKFDLNGKKIWQTEVGSETHGWGCGTSPVLFKNLVAYCLRLSDGEVLYSKRFPEQPYASATAGDGKIYIVTRYGGTFVHAATPEFTQLAHNELDDDSTFNASPVISNGQLLLRSDRYLYCIDAG